MLRFGIDGLRRLGDFQGFFGGQVLMVIGFGILLALVIFCTVVCIKYLKSTHKQKQIEMSADAAVGILKERYARGEITEEEYMQKIKNLTVL